MKRILLCVLAMLACQSAHADHHVCRDNIAAPSVTQKFTDRS